HQVDRGDANSIPLPAGRAGRHQANGRRARGRAHLHGRSRSRTRLARVHTARTGRRRRPLVRHGIGMPENEHDALEPMLPPYAKGLRRCPVCGSKSFVRFRLPRDIVLPFEPRGCNDCRHTWTPLPPRALTLVYAAFGALMLITALGSPLLIGAMIVGWIK